MSVCWFIGNCTGSSCYMKTNKSGTWMEMVSECPDDAEMVAMDSSSNKTFIDGVSNGDTVWIRGTNLRWIWGGGDQIYSYIWAKISSVICL